MNSKSINYYNNQLRKTFINLTGLSLAIVILLFITGCGKEDTTYTPPPIGVKISEAQITGFDQQISYSGTIEESVSITLSFSIGGTVDRVLVSEGQKVRKGELLASVNAESFKNAYELALAKQKQAEDAYKRFEPMFKNSTVPEIKIVEIQTGLKQSIASTAIAKKNWEDCRLVSPTDGIIGNRSIEPGMNVLPNIPVLTLVKIESVFVRFPVPENEVAHIMKDQKAEIDIPALGLEHLNGKVDEIGVIANALSRSYDVKIILPNSTGNIRPGMVCNVRLISEKKIQGAVVPNESVLVDENGSNYVYIADEKSGKALKRLVTIGPIINEGICIINGLQPGEKVIISGTQKVTDNAPIKIGL